MRYANEVTLYIYYIKDKYEFEYGEMLPIFNNIFAYTTDKKVAKLFEEQRNMKLFKKDKQEMTIPEYNDFLRHMTGYDDRYLCLCSYDFYSNNNTKLSKEMAVTATERRRIECRKAMLEINITKYCWYSPYIFNSNIYKALKSIKYNDVFNFIGSYPNKLLKDKNTDADTIEDIIKINELELVIEVIGRTLDN